MKKTRLLFIIPVLIACSCASQRGLTDKDITISIEATPCMGDCPVYRAEIYTNGVIIYEGRENVEKIGHYTGKLSPKKLTKLQLAFEEADFFSMQDEYVASWTDLPTVWLYYSNGDRKKRIKDYYGAPEALKKLEEEVLALFDSITWKDH
jgi:hypothetical protein